MATKKGPIEHELNIFSSDGKTVTENAVKAALTKAANDDVFVRKIAHAHTTGSTTVVLPLKRNGAS